MKRRRTKHVRSKRPSRTTETEERNHPDVRGPQDSLLNSLADDKDEAEDKFDYDDIVQQSFPASDPPPLP